MYSKPQCLTDEQWKTYLRIRIDYGLKNISALRKKYLQNPILSGKIKVQTSNYDGGKGSGNFGHAGRQGQRGGSAPGHFGGATSGDFAPAIKAAKDAVAVKNPDKAWRVTAHTQKEFDDDYHGATLHITKGGSTVAVTESGDIISVCKNPNDSMKGKTLIKFAVANGGKKLDSYSGNHGFYVKCGFEPVSWCKFDEKYAPSDWVKGRDKAEPIIFYKYTGKKSKYEKPEQFISAVKASKDYDTAQSVRDNSI